MNEEGAGVPTCAKLPPAAWNSCVSREQDTAKTKLPTFSSTLTTKYSYDIVCKTNVVESPFLQLAAEPGTVDG